MPALRSRFDAIPLDLLAVGLAVLGGVLSTLPVVDGTPLRFVLALPLVGIAPGYALLAALIPPARRERRSGEGRQLEFTERLGLSVVSTLVILTIAGMVLNVTGPGIRLVPTVAVLGGLALLLAAVAAWRRARLPAEHRSSAGLSRVASVLLAPYRDSSAVGLSPLLVAVCVAVALTSVAYVVTAPAPAAPHTEFYLMTENESGDRVLEDYPTQFTVGEPQSLLVGVENHEGRTVSYTVIVLLQAVEFTDGTERVTNEATLARFNPRVGAGEAWLRPHTVVPPFAGERLRLTYLLYRGSPPADHGIDTADRTTYLWISATPANATASQ